MVDVSEFIQSGKFSMDIQVTTEQRAKIYNSNLGVRRWVMRNEKNWI